VIIETLTDKRKVAPVVTVRELSPFRLPEDWEGFAEKGGCSFTALRGYIATTAIMFPQSGRVRCFEVFIDNGGDRKTKLAQATVMTRRKEYKFLHRIAISSGFEELWSEAMLAILSHIGPGKFRYTWRISDEKSRSAAIGKLPSVTIESVRSLFNQSVYFSNWRSWDDYYEAISMIAKKESSRASKKIEGLNIVTKRGLAALTEVSFLAKCKVKTRAAKRVSFKVPFPGLRFALVFALQSLLIGDRQVVSVVRSGERRLAVLSGIEFGQYLFYIDGGRLDDWYGAQWYLIIETFKEFFSRRPNGVVEMGHFEPAGHVEEIGDGLLKSRRSLRVTDAPTSIVVFGYDPDPSAKSHGLSVDVEAYNAAMERQRTEARRAWAGSGEAATETVWYALRERVGATGFLGYETETAEGVVRAIVKDGVEVDRLDAGEKGLLILDQTPFYGESGGQVGDVGEIAGPSFRAAVADTRKTFGDLIVHVVAIVDGSARVGMAVELTVDHAARTATRANHSATHILHEALRLVLGEHIAQKGSLVSREGLRFDFAHPKAITRDELAAVEEIANRVVLENVGVTTRLMSLDDARNSGARALFGEKHGDEVRVVSMGQIEDATTHKRAYSVELCGGTHVSRTGDIGLITIVGESAVASGVRRIEAKTRDEARKKLTAVAHAYAEIARLLQAPAEEALKRLESLIVDKRKLERELTDAKRKLLISGGDSSGTDVVCEVAGVRFYARLLTGVDVKDLKSLADEAKQSVGSGVVAIAARAEDGRASLVVAVTLDQTARFNAIDLVRLGSTALGGKGGGGRPDMAQAGGPNGANAGKALAAIEDAIRARA
jgi:Ser-tRNA(Ala) deacylase AlaX